MHPRIPLKTIKWHHHPNRKFAISLHRLRSGHNYLNVFSHRIDTGADPSCRFVCEALENSHYILINCPKNEHLRTKIRRFAPINMIPLDAESLIGLNPPIDTNKQFEIRNCITRFLEKSALTEII